MDWYTRYVLSWKLSNTLDVSFCLDALTEALTKEKPEIFNTDQGSQFTSKVSGHGVDGCSKPRLEGADARKIEN